MRWKAAPPPTPTKHTASPPTYGAAQRFAFESRSPKRLGVALPGPKAIRRRTLGPQNNPTSHFRALKQSDVAPSDPKTIRRPAIHAISCICAEKMHETTK